MKLAMGDELTLSYDGTQNLWFYARKLGHVIGDNVATVANRGASITGPRRIDLVSRSKRTNFRSYDGIIMFYGLHDYLDRSGNLGVIAHDLTQAIQNIHHANPKAKLYGILPYNIYPPDGTSDNNVRKKCHYTFRDLLAMLAVTYSNNFVPALNWATLRVPLVTKMNQKRHLNHGIYPNRATYEAMIKIIGKFVKDH